MSWIPKEYFLSPQEFFGALIPGAAGTAIVFFALRKTGLARPFLELSHPAQWVAFGGCALVLGLLAYPLGWPLDKLYDHAYAKRRRRAGDPLLQSATALAELDHPGISHSKDKSIYEWAKIKVEAKDSAVIKERGRLQGISKMFRSFALMFLIGAVFLLAQSYTLLAIVFLGTFFISFLLFCQRRWEATTSSIKG